MLSKKGETPALAKLGGLLLIALGILILFPNVAKTGVLIDEGKEAYVCLLSISKGEGTAQCPIHSVVIKQEVMEIDGDEKKLPTAEGRNAPSDAIGGLLRSCLAKGGGSSSNAFGRSNWFESERVCIICDTITLEGVSVSGLSSYLNEKTPISLEKTYMEFLSEDEEKRKLYVDLGKSLSLTSPSGIVIPSSIDGTLIPAKTYHTIFLGIKKGSSPNAWDNLNNIASLNAYALLFASNDLYFSYLVDSAKLPQICERIVN